MSLRVVFILIVVAVHRTRGQACTWIWIEPAGSTAMTRSVGAPATFLASVNDVLTDTALVTWKNGASDLSIEEYSTATSSFTSLVSSTGVTTSFQPGSGGSNNVYSMVLASSSVTLANNGATITVTSQGCTSSGTSPAVTLTVRYCDLTFFGSHASASDTSDCGYNCVREFTCASDTTKTFSVTCGQDAEWASPTFSGTDVPCAGSKDGAFLGLVILCSILSIVRLF